MKVEAPQDSRFDLALEVFEEHGTMQFRDLYLDRRRGELEVSLESSWSIENTTRERADIDLQRARQNIEALREASPRFAQLVRGLNQRIVLFYGYGMGGVNICEETASGVRWFAAEQAVAADGAAPRR